MICVVAGDQQYLCLYSVSEFALYSTVLTCMLGII
jgi:hypothetical protein